MATAERLKKNRDFSRVYRAGTYQGDRWAGLHAYKHRGTYAGRSPRVGFTVSRVIRGAVPRNRAKRLLRESFRLSRIGLSTGYDLIVTARWSPGKEPALMELIDSVSQLIIDSGAGYRKSDAEGNNGSCVRDGE